MKVTKNTEKKYREKRYQQFDRGELNIKHLLSHRVANKIMINLITLQRIMNRERLFIIGDKRKRTNSSIIFSPMHIGGKDVEMVFEAIKTYTWIMIGDPRELYRNLSGTMLKLNGVIWFDTLFKKDRHIAKMRSIELLKHDENLIMFPEGAYNISPNRLVMYPYSGLAEIAITTSSDIVPIGLVRNGKDYYVNIGENISTGGYKLEQKYELTDLLRNRMAHLCWEIMEALPITKRKTLGYDYYNEIFLKEIFAEEGYTYTVNDVKETLYRPKGIEGDEFKEGFFIDDLE